MSKGKLTSDQQLNDYPTDQEICLAYESLQRAIKRGTWPSVASIMITHRYKKDKKWAAKHYLNSFAKAKYTSVLTSKEKDSINVKREKMMRKPNYSLKEIVSSILADYKNSAIFPNAISSYVY